MALREELAKPQEPTLTELLIRYLDMRNAGAWSQKAKVGNLKKFMAAYNFLEENHIYSLDELESQIHALSDESDALLAQMRENNARMKKLDDMISFAGHIHRIQPIIDEMNAIHWKGRREKFRAAHERDIDLYYFSKRVLKDTHGVKKIDIPAWQTEQKALRQQDEELSAQYKPIHEKVDQMLNVKHCLEIAKHALRENQKTKTSIQQGL